MEKILTKAQAMGLLRARVDASGGQTEFANKHFLSRSVLCDVLNGRRDLSASILWALKLERVNVYRPVANGKGKR